jgi:hypothetical protein
MATDDDNRIGRSLAAEEARIAALEASKVLPPDTPGDGITPAAQVQASQLERAAVRHEQDEADRVSAGELQSELDVVAGGSEDDVDAELDGDEDEALDDESGYEESEDEEDEEPSLGARVEIPTEEELDAAMGISPDTITSPPTSEAAAAAHAVLFDSGDEEDALRRQQKDSQTGSARKRKAGRTQRSAPE